MQMIEAFDCIFCMHVHVHAVPGVMGSQLTVLDASKACDTARKYKDLWLSPTRLLLHNSCAKKELPCVVHVHVYIYMHAFMYMYYYNEAPVIVNIRYPICTAAI